MARKAKSKIKEIPKPDTQQFDENVFQDDIVIEDVSGNEAEEEKEASEEPESKPADNEITPSLTQQMLTHDLLAREEETELFNKMNDAITPELRKIYRDEIVSKNFRLVHSLVQQKARKGKLSTTLTYDDLFQEGCLGMMKAIERFDVSKGTKFSTYATSWINKQLNEAISANGMAYKIPPSEYQLLTKIMAIANKMESENGKRPSIEELSEIIGEKPEKINTLIKAGAPHLSIDQPIGSSKDSSSSEKVTTIEQLVARDLDESVDNQVINNINRDMFMNAVHKLFDKETASYIVMRFGLNGGRPATFTEISQYYGNHSYDYVKRKIEKSLALVMYYCNNGRLPMTRAEAAALRKKKSKSGKTG